MAKKRMLLLDDLLLHLARQVVPDLVRRGTARSAGRPRPAPRVRARRSCPRTRTGGRRRSSARSTRYAERIGRGLDAQVRDGDRARLLRVVDEVALRVEIGLLADDLDRVLVGAHGAVGAEAVEHRRRHVVRPRSGTTDPTASDVCVTSSTMPTVKWRFGRVLARARRRPPSPSPA